MSVGFLNVLKRLTLPWETLKSAPQVKELEAVSLVLDERLQKARSELEVNLQAFREALQERKGPNRGS